ncbi:Bestrophin, RFP-TM, chloride channel-domain-containing protein [Ephemerocybe angulata]|uniref:Bestrophin, RFP-TM, chloride channel-domain-containing protein n=1 Tax=Ephemerocybe angulata TaxID=980116 RepID=A0A8H6IG48_9AGAR|nr:Bestrophin, RFP-TM, chloride channel-domain-containing protein [Tulosesus angulatus]
MSGITGTVKSFSSTLPTLKPIKRKHLRKYSWLPDVLRVKGSIIGRIIGPVLTVTCFAAAVAYASTKGYTVVWTNSIVPLLSVVVGLILVFRNSTSYDRYWEGRKAFGTVTTHTRNFARQLWIYASLPPTDEAPAGTKGKTPTTTLTHVQLRKRKIEAIHLCLSFAYAAKHYLRGEDGINYADYVGVLPLSFAKYDNPQGYAVNHASSPASYAAGKGVPEFAAASRDGSVTRSGTNTPDALKSDPTKRIRAKRSKTQLPHADQTTPLLAQSYRSIDFHSYGEEASMPLPLIIAHELGRMVYAFRRDGCLETVGPAGLNGLSQMIQGLVDQLSIMERVANTPIPASYGIHLKQCVTLYLFALPLTLVNDLGWAIVPIVTVVAFTFMGIEGIAEEIEMPFGTDERDLPLDRYCQDLKEEIYYLIDRLPEGGVGMHGYDDGEGDD